MVELVGELGQHRGPRRPLMCGSHGHHRRDERWSLALDVLRALAVALSVSTDALVFNENERGPADQTFAVHLEALNRLDDDERATILNLIESVLLRQEARRLARAS